MKKLHRGIFVSSIVLFMFNSSGSFVGRSAQGSASFLYVNNDTPILNTVAGFGINSDGTLSQLGNSPFLTGGVGGRTDPDFSNASIHVHDNFLFVANSLTNNVSVFTIRGDGSLETVPGSPFATGGTNPLGITSNQRGTFLFVTNRDSNNISVFSISTNGVLTPVSGSPFPTTGLATPTGLAINISGSLLFVGFRNAIGTFSVDAEGHLAAAVAPQSTDFSAQSLVLHRSDRFLSVGIGDSANIAVFFTAPNGSLLAAAGSPDANGTARGTRAVVFHPSADLVFATADSLATVSVFRLVFTGLLSPVPGSPFSTDGSDSRAFAFHPSGEIAYLANRGDRTITVLRIGKNGESVTPVPGGKTPLGSLLAKPSGLAVATGIRSL